MSDTLSGVWKSGYKFYDKARDAYYWSEYYVRARRKGDTLIFESIPVVNEAYLFMRLHIDNNLATGSWREESSKKGFYEGLIYIGAVQLLISEDQKTMTGKWVAYGKYKTMNDGAWEMTYIGEELPAGTDVILTERPAKD